MAVKTERDSVLQNTVQFAIQRVQLSVIPRKSTSVGQILTVVNIATFNVLYA